MAEIEPISLPERPNLYASVVRSVDRAPTAFVFHRDRLSSHRELLADILTVSPEKIRRQANLDVEPLAWLVEIVPAVETGTEYADIRPLDCPAPVSTDAELSRIALLSCRPRLRDGNAFDIQVQTTGDLLFVHISTRNGRFQTLALAPDEDRDKIAELAETLADPQAGAPSGLETALKLGGVTAGLRDIGSGQRDDDPWRMFHGLVIFLQSWGGLPESIREGAEKPLIENTSAPEGHAPPPAGPVDLGWQRVILTGLHVTQLLMAASMFDLAAWSAEQTRLIAKERKSWADVAEAARLGCIAAEGIADAAGIELCSTDALDALRRADLPPSDRRRTLRSVVVSRLVAEQRSDTLPADEWQKELPEARVRAGGLDALMDEVEELHDPVASRSADEQFQVANDAVQRARIAALRGSLDKAVDLNRAAHAMPMAPHPLLASLLFNDQLSVRFRRASLGMDPPVLVRGALDAAAKFWAGLPDQGATMSWRRAHFLLLAARTHLLLEEFEQAAQAAVHASDEYASVLSNRVRPLPPNSERGCVDLAAVADLAQYCLTLLTDAGLQTKIKGYPHAVNAALIADMSKSRQLRQAMGFAATDLEDLLLTLPKPLKAVLDNSQANIVDTTQDARVILANLHTAARYAGESSNYLLDLYKNFPIGLNLASRVPASIVLVDLFAGRDRTFVYVIVAGQLAAFHLEIKRAELSQAAAQLKAAFNGSKYMAPIDSDAPAARDRYLAPARDLADRLAQSILPYLEQCDHLMIAPSAEWFDLPIEAWIQQTARRDGIELTVSSMPGIGAGMAIGSRTCPPNESVLFGLIVSPAADDHDTKPFEDAKSALKDALVGLGAKSNAVVAVLKADETTVETFNLLAPRCDLLHILAHGQDRNASDPLKSGLILSDQGIRRSFEAGANLTAADILARPFRADLVTLQACSLGRLRSTPEGELWGLTRAFLSSGAAAVIAPLWDVDILSSTALFTDMYRRWGADETPSLAEAFTKAQLAMAERPEDDPWSHVYHWGAFRLIGGCALMPEAVKPSSQK